RVPGRRYVAHADDRGLSKAEVEAAELNSAIALSRPEAMQALAHDSAPLEPVRSRRVCKGPAAQRDSYPSPAYRVSFPPTAESSGRQRWPFHNQPSSDPRIWVRFREAIEALPATHLPFGRS